LRTGPDFGRAALHGGDEAAEGSAALLDVLAQPLAFAQARDAKIREGLLKYSSGSIKQCLVARIATGIPEHAGPAQHIEHIDARSAPQPGGEGADGRDHALERLGVDINGGLAGSARPDAEGAIDLAALEAALREPAEIALEAAQDIGQAESDLEKAMIDAAQLAHEGAPGAGCFLTGKAGHAGDHGYTFTGCLRRGGRV